MINVGLRITDFYCNGFAGRRYDLADSIIYITLKFSNKLSKILGKNGMMVLRKVFGIICLAIAIKMIKFNLFL